MRREFTLDIMEFDSIKSEFKKVYEWYSAGNRSENRLKSTRIDDDALLGVLADKTLRVTSVLVSSFIRDVNEYLMSLFMQEEPFTMLKRDYKSRKGNDRFEGFCIDLIEEISKRVGFNYTIKIVEDGKYGNEVTYLVDVIRYVQCQLINISPRLTVHGTEWWVN